MTVFFCIFFEKKPYDNGTNYLASIVKSQKSKRFFSAAGGGDTISALRQSNFIDYFSFISTGGGAFLEFIEGKSLPGIEILNKVRDRTLQNYKGGAYNSPPDTPEKPPWVRESSKKLTTEINKYFRKNMMTKNTFYDKRRRNRRG